MALEAGQVAFTKSRKKLIDAEMSQGLQRARAHGVKAHGVKEAILEGGNRKQKAGRDSSQYTRPISNIPGTGEAQPWGEIVAGSDGSQKQGSHPWQMAGSLTSQLFSAYHQPPFAPGHKMKPGKVGYSEEGGI